MPGDVLHCFYTIRPLHGLTSDVPRIELRDNLVLLRHDSEFLGGILIDPEGISALRKYRELFEPEYFLVGEVGGDVEILNLSPKDEGLRGHAQWLLARIDPTTSAACRAIRALRLFKPGRLRAGPVYVILKGEFDEHEYEIEVGISGEGSYFPIGREHAYELKASEVPFLREFAERLESVGEKLIRGAKWELAAGYYERSFDNKGRQYEWIDLSIAMEAVLLQQGDQELSFRLALRAANLLGTDDDERIRIFKQVKESYDLRSKIVHGAELTTEHQSSLRDVDGFREIVRRVLLSSMGLALETGFGPEFYRALDLMGLSASSRETSQKFASHLLHIDTGRSEGS